MKPSMFIDDAAAADRPRSPVRQARIRMELLVVPEVRFHDPRVDVVFPDRTGLRRTCLTPGIVYGASAEGETGVYEGFVDVDDPESIIKD